MIGKLLLILLAVIFFFGIFVFGPLYNHLAAQVVLLLIVLVFGGWRTSWRDIWGLIKFCVPFVLTLFCFGALFHVTHFLGRSDWLMDSLIKMLVFPSSLIFLKALLTYITYLDILRLPIKMARRVDLITFRAALSKGGRVMRRFRWYLTTYQQPPEKGGIRVIKRLFHRYASLILALYLYLYEEIENSRMVLENRRQFLSRPK